MFGKDKAALIGFAILVCVSITLGIILVNWVNSRSDTISDSEIIKNGEQITG